MILNPVVYGGKDLGPFSDLKHIGHVDYTSSNWSQGDSSFSLEIDEPWVSENIKKNVVVYGLYAGAYYDGMVPAFQKSKLGVATTGITFWGTSGNAGFIFREMGYVSWSVDNNILKINGRNVFIENNPNASVKHSGNCVYLSLDFYLVE